MNRRELPLMAMEPDLAERKYEIRMPERDAMRDRPGEREARA